MLLAFRQLLIGATLKIQEVMAVKHIYVNNVVKL